MKRSAVEKLLSALPEGKIGVAGFSCALAAGESIVTAAQFGTLCSAVTVRMLNQTGAPTPEKLLETVPYSD